MGGLSRPRRHPPGRRRRQRPPRWHGGSFRNGSALARAAGHRSDRLRHRRGSARHRVGSSDYASAALRWQEGQTPTLSLPLKWGREAPFSGRDCCGAAVAFGYLSQDEGAYPGSLNVRVCGPVAQYLGDKGADVSIYRVRAVDGGGDRGEHEGLTESRGIARLAPDPAAIERL